MDGCRKLNMQLPESWIELVNCVNLLSDID